MTFKLGSTDINKVYLGSTEIRKAYLGSTEIYNVGGGPPPGVERTLYGSFDFIANGRQLYENQEYTSGTLFRSTAAGTLLRVRWQHSSWAGAQETKAWRLYLHSNQSLLASGSFATPNGGSQEAWVEDTLGTPQAIAQNTDYMLVIDINANNTYYKTPTQYYSGGNPQPGEGPLVNVMGYFTTTQGNYPTSTYNNEGYALDVIVETT